MKDNYAAIVGNNLHTLFAKRTSAELADLLPGAVEGDGVRFQAFGGSCHVSPKGILLSGDRQEGPLGIIISLYALNAGPGDLIEEPYKSFKDFPGSMPYVGAFAAYTQEVLVPHVNAIGSRLPEILGALGGRADVGDVGGDLSFVVTPLPKISLCYILYEADEDFPASVTCLFSSNATDFMPMDGLADTGEYTSRKILEILG